MQRVSSLLVIFLISCHLDMFRYAKLGLMGVTVVYSSGDNGVAGEYDPPWNFWAEAHPTAYR